MESTSHDYERHCQDIRPPGPAHLGWDRRAHRSTIGTVEVFDSET